MEIIYHKATMEDISILVEQRIRFTIELSGEQPQEKIEALKRQLTDYFSKATLETSCISIIAEYNGMVAGIGSIHFRTMPGNFKNPSGKWGYLMNMYTLPEFRRKGICKSILNLLLEEGKAIGIYAFELHATREGAFVYNQNGFNIHNEPTYRKYSGNENNQDL